MKLWWSLFALSPMGFASPAAAAETMVFKSVEDFSKNLLHHTCSSCGGTTHVYDSFVLAKAATVNRITYNAWREEGYDPLTPAVEFYTGTPEAPGSLISTYKLATEDIVFSGPSGDPFGGTLVVANIPAITLEAGTTYVLSLYSRHLPPESAGFAWGTYAGTDGTAYQGSRPINERAGFWLSYAADVPEPTSWAMMVVGFGIVGWALRRTDPSSSIMRKVGA